MASSLIRTLYAIIHVSICLHCATAGNLDRDPPMNECAVQVSPTYEGPVLNSWQRYNVAREETIIILYNHDWMPCKFHAGDTL